MTLSLVKKIKMIGMLWIVVHRQSPLKQVMKGSDGFHNLHSIKGISVTSLYHAGVSIKVK